MHRCPPLQRRRNEICWRIVTCVVGKSSEFGMFTRTPVKKGYSSSWLERSTTSVRLGKFSRKTLIWENQHHSSTLFIWVALEENVKSARILWIITEVCSNQGFLLEPKKNYRPELQGKLDAETISSWSYNMEGRAKKCMEMFCELANKTTQQ